RCWRRQSAFLRHRALDQTDDGHEYGSTYSAAGDVAQYRAQIQRATASRLASHYALEQRATKATAHNSRDRIARGAKAILFHCCSCDIATDCAADCFNDQTNYIHSFEF